METDIQIFKNEEFGEIRTLVVDNEPWFVLKDVCAAFGESNYRRVSARLDDDEKGVSQMDTPGGKQAMTVINESGVYSALFAMQPEKARGVTDDYILQRQAQLRKFKKWVTSEVLPSIRKHGGYLTPQKVDEILSDPDTIIRLATNLKAERQKRLEAERNAEERQKRIEEQQPKVAFAEAITSSKTSCLVGELAKLIKQSVERTGRKIAIGQNRFYEWLRENGFLGKSNNYYNVANQEYVEQGLFELKKSVHDENGVLVTKTTTKITGKGQQYFINGFLSGKFKIA